MLRASTASLWTNTRSHGTLTSSHSSMLSVSSNRNASGLSNSLTASRSNGLRDHSDRPGALQGMAQVIDCGN